MGKERKKNTEPSIVWAIVLLATVLGYFPGTSDDIPLPPVQRGHKTAECSQCHAVIADINASAAIPVIDSQCRGCHSDQALQRNNAVTFHANLSRRCTECHFFHRPDSIDAAGREFQIQSHRIDLQTTCASCHGAQQDLQLLSPGHRAAARLFHSELIGAGNLSPSEACMLCHSDRERPDMVAYGEVPQFDAYHTHPVGIKAVITDLGGSKIKSISDSRVRLFNGKMECQTCHSLSSPTQFHLAGFDTREDLCRACHQFE